MSKTISFKVNLTFSKNIKNEDDIQEIARNITRAIENEASGAGIAPISSDAYTKNIDVTPIGDVFYFNPKRSFD